MQTKKDFISDLIVNAAREEFLANGYPDTSMRSIASRAGVTLSNIYNYFRNKDELFEEILTPLLRIIEQAKINLLEHSEENENQEVDNHDQMIIGVIRFFKTNKDLLQLLVFKSTGSKYENFREDFINWYLQIYKHSVEKYSNDLNIKNVEISTFTLKSLIGLIFNAMTEFLKSDINEEEALIVSKEILAFNHSGWIGMMKWKSTV